MGDMMLLIDSGTLLLGINLVPRPISRFIQIVTKSVRTILAAVFKGKPGTPSTILIKGLAN
jgi:hypothetical protein